MPFLEDTPLIRQALTHRSAAASPEEGNERLEFLGDALIGAFVAEWLFANLPVTTAEGTLSRLRSAVVRRETLARVARNLGLHERLQVGAGERKESRQTTDRLMANAYEAVVAALFREQGREAMAQFLMETLCPALLDAVAQPDLHDPKTLLQERLQQAGKGRPHYRVLAQVDRGSHHYFEVEALTEDGERLGVGTGANRRAAEQEAAREGVRSSLIPPVSS
jgi:ribonuclease-3